MSKVTVQVKADTSTFERKLRTIAEHATLLADELMMIDKEACPDCGSSNVQVTKAFGDSNEPEVVIDCFECESKVEDSDD